MEQRINILENKVDSLIEEAKEVSKETDLEAETVKARGLIVELFAARRALYGYTSLISSMGLGKDATEAMRKIQDLVNMIIRLQQTIAITQLALVALETGHPYLALIRIAMGGGMAAAALTYGSRTGGG
jgi:hypothetical protein